MNVKSKIFTLFLVLITIVGKGQKTGLYWNNLNENSNRLQGKITGEVYYLDVVEGKYHFYHDKWYNGSIVLTDGDVIENMKLRYMSFSDKLIAYNDAIRSLFIVDKDIVDTFYIDSEKIKQKFVRIYYDGTPDGHRYFEVLYSGTRLLLVYHTIIVKKIRPYKNEFGILSDTEYEKDKTYYLYSQSSGFERIKISRRSLYHVFPDQKKEIKKVLRENKIEYKNEWSLIRAVSELDKAGIFD